VWNLNGQLFVINEDGDIIREARPDLYLNLPLVSGDGANKHASEILAMITTRPALMERVYALVRVDTRRWDIVLKDNSVIKLPALNPERALENLDRYIAKEKILDQGFAYIDLRDPESVAVLDWEEAKARHLSPPPIDGSDLLASQTPPPPPPPPPA
jgi:cell division protein FtsQ